MIKNVITILVLVLFTLNANAQSSDETKVIKTKRLKIEISQRTDTAEIAAEGAVEAAEDAMVEAERAMEQAAEAMEEAEQAMPENEGENDTQKTRIKTVETSWFVMEWGFSNWIGDNGLELPADFEDLVLRKSSSNFHLGIIQQGVNIIKGNLRLVYGAGIEYNRYKFDKSVTITRGANPMEYMIDEEREYRRNNLVSTYATIPLMLNYKSNPKDDDNSVKIAAGVQFGYLIGSNQNQKWGYGKDKEKRKVKGDYGFEDYRMGYTAQFGYGDFVLYGRYFPTNTFKSNRGPEVNTACVGIVLSPF